MKFIIDNDKYIVFLKEKINLEGKLEKYFKGLFTKLKNKYNLEFNGYYNINVYTDKHYGVIIEIIKNEMDYYTYFNQIDMEINIIKTDFYYEIDYNFLNKKILNKCACYKYNDKMYLKIIKEITPFELSNILEYSNILYGEELEKIIKYSKKVIV